MKTAIQPFEYCKNCGLVYAHIQNFECVVCHGKLDSIEGLNIPDRVAKNLQKAPVSGSLPFKKCGEGDNVCNCKSADECGYL